MRAAEPPARKLLTELDALQLHNLVCGNAFARGKLQSVTDFVNDEVEVCVDVQLCADPPKQGPLHLIRIIRREQDFCGLPEQRQMRPARVPSSLGSRGAAGPEVLGSVTIATVPRTFIPPESDRKQTQ